MESPSRISKANTTFSLALFKKLSDDDKTGNIFYSSFSISSALAMVMLGARGNTAVQMSQVLSFTEAEQPRETEALSEGMPSAMQSQMRTRRQLLCQIQQQSRLPPYLRKMCTRPQNGEDDVHSEFNELMGELVKENVPYALSLANRLYGEESYQFLENFLNETKKFYNAELKTVDFKTNTEAARVIINNWVQEQTQGKIIDLLVPGVLSSSTRLVLVNAIYFKGNWETKFKEELTADAEFRISKTVTKQVKMMFQKSEFPLKYIPEVNCQILEMPYKGKDLSMLIFLPNEIEDDTTGLEKLERELTYDNFVKWTDKPEEREVEVKLPRFKMEEKYDLNDVLKSMGMVDAFDVGKSNFTGMSLANDLVLSKVVHEAFVEVNEEGTEAAAATAAIISERSLNIPDKFIADHAFLFFIQHKPSKSVLFAGRYCSPE